MLLFVDQIHFSQVCPCQGWKFNRKVGLQGESPFWNFMKIFCPFHDWGPLEAWVVGLFRWVRCACASEFNIQSRITPPFFSIWPFVRLASLSFILWLISLKPPILSSAFVFPIIETAEPIIGAAGARAFSSYIRSAGARALVVVVVVSIHFSIRFVSPRRTFAADST